MPEFFARSLEIAGDGRPLVAVSQSRQAWTGALPLLLDDHRLRAWRTEHSPGFDYFGESGALVEIWSALRDDPCWAELVLDKVPAESPLATILPALALSDGYPTIVRPDTSHPFFELPGFEASLKPKFRTNVQRCARKAGELALERIVAPSADDLAEATAIEAMAWKGANGTSIASDPRVAHLYEAVLGDLGARGKAALVFLRANGRRIATMFEVEDAHTLFALKIGYDPQFANISPGHLIVWKLALDAEARGLRELDFVGHEDEWKRKWTDRVHERVAIVIYRRSPRGLARYAMRELIKPRVPQTWRDTPRSPLPRRCQRADIVGEHTVIARARSRITSGLGIRSGLRRALAGKKPKRLGEPSAFAVGTWVKVRDADAIRAGLDPQGRTRGLAFVPAQWQTCGGVFRVASHVRRIRDDHGRYRAVSRTVLLEGVDCGFGATQAAGCGRHCPLMFRDDWLEAAQMPAKPAPAPARRHARVRDGAEIVAGLDVFGRRDGLTFMPEMAEHAGKRFAVLGTIERVFEHDQWVPTRAPLYMLEGLHCTGGLCGKRGPCDRACTLMWHPDWLIVEPDAPERS